MGKKLDDQLKTFYTGTQKELKEKIPNGGGFYFLWIAEGAVAICTMLKAIGGEFDYFSAMGMPLTIDWTSRVYKGIRQKFKEMPEHTPNVVGQIREYHQNKNLEGKLEE